MGGSRPDSVARLNANIDLWLLHEESRVAVFSCPLKSAYLCIEIGNVKVREKHLFQHYFQGSLIIVEQFGLNTLFDLA